MKSVIFYKSVRVESSRLHNARRSIVGLIVMFLTFLSCLITACLPKRVTISEVAVRNKHIPVFIEMPCNVHVFDNIAPILYQALHTHFRRVGYEIVDRPSAGYALRVHINNLEQHQKLVSPDVILVDYNVRFEFDCVLHNFAGKIVTQKKFFISTLISKSRNPIINSDFLDYEYKRLCANAASQVERYVKPYLIKAFENPT